MLGEGEEGVIAPYVGCACPRSAKCPEGKNYDGGDVTDRIAILVRGL